MTQNEVNKGETTKHIALFVPSMRGGGAERIMVMLANGFSARGHRVDLVLAQAVGPFLSEVSSSVRVIDLSSLRVLRSFWPLVTYLKQSRPDVMLSALTHANIVAIAAKMIARSSTRLIVSEHNSPSNSLGGGFADRMLEYWMRKLYRRTQGIVCVSDGVAQELNKTFGMSAKLLATIHNPVDIDAVEHAMTQQIDHPWLDETSEEVILAAGRLDPQKDYPTLLQALQILARTRDVRLIILGEGPELGRLQDLAVQLEISDRVVFAGFVANPFAWMFNTDLFVMSSAWEGFGNVLIEAMACSARVVSTDCPSGPSEILEDGRWGRLVPVGDAQALAGAMSAALVDVSPPKTAQRASDFGVAQALDAYADVLLVNC